MWTCIEQRLVEVTEFHCLCSSCSLQNTNSGYIDAQVCQIRFQVAYRMSDTRESFVESVRVAE